MPRIIQHFGNTLEMLSPYKNQQIAANQILEYFANGETTVQLSASPQAGKTGVALYVAEQILEEHINAKVLMIGPSDLPSK